MFGEISPRYDMMNHVLSGGVDVWWRRKTVKRVPPAEHGAVLDVCTGTGDLAIAYWKSKKGRVPVVGADFTPEMVRLADQKAERYRNRYPNAEPLTFLEADTQQLPFEDDRFDVVSVAFGLRNVSDTMAGLREMTRVCRPGGKVAVLEFSMPKRKIIGGAYRWYFKNVLPRIGQLFAKNKQSAYNYLPDSVSEFPSGNALTEMMEAAGLEESSFHPLTFGVATLYVGQKRSETPKSMSVSPAASNR